MAPEQHNVAPCDEIIPPEFVIEIASDPSIPPLLQPVAWMFVLCLISTLTVALHPAGKIKLDVAVTCPPDPDTTEVPQKVPKKL